MTKWMYFTSIALWSTTLFIHAAPNAYAAPSLNIPILTYHYIEHIKDPKDTIRVSLTTSPELLQSQIQTLKHHGYAFLFASDISDILDNPHLFSSRSVVFTFDDGYEDFYTDAYPIIQKEKIPVTIYLISEYIGKRNYMSHTQIKEILRSKYVEIGSHTQHHISLDGKPEQTLKREIVESKYTLQLLFGVPIQTFSYPYGSYDTRAISMVQAAGYRQALTTTRGTNHTTHTRYMLSRIDPGSRVGDHLITYLQNNTK